MLKKIVLRSRLLKFHYKNKLQKKNKVNKTKFGHSTKSLHLFFQVTISNSGQQNPIKSSRNCKRLGKNDDEYSLKVDERLILLFFYFKISRANKKKTKEKL